MASTDIDDETGPAIRWSDRSEAAPPVVPQKNDEPQRGAAAGGRVGGRPSTRPTELLIRRMSQIPTQMEEKVHVHGIHGKGSRRAKVLEFIHSKPVQWTLMGLLILDVFLLFTEMFLSSSFPLCFIIERDSISCCPLPDLYNFEDHGNEDADAHRILAGDTDGSAHNDESSTCVTNWTSSAAEEEHIRRIRFLAKDDDGGHHQFCDHGIDTPQCPAACDDHKYHGVHTAEEVIFWITIAILSIFMVELICLIFCIGPRKFFSKFFYALDFFIVSVSLVLEIFFHLQHKDQLEFLVGFIVILRCWR